MEKLFDVKIQGVRWVSNNPHGARKRCAAMHGQEFYYKPKAGQLSIDQLPRIPLHPNCRCTTMPIHVTSLASRASEALGESFPDNQEASPDRPHVKPYMINETNSFDFLIFRNSGGKAPIWGKYCDDGWSAGRNLNDPYSEPVVDRSPEDSLDSACQDHDNCYDGDDTLPCDEALIRRLQSLDPDPSKWPNPPTTDLEMKYAKRYRGLAIFWFKWQAAYTRSTRQMQDDVEAGRIISP